MQVLAQLDPQMLEEQLLDRLEKLQSAGTAARTLVLVPSSALAGHLQRSMARRRDAWLGVDVVNFRASAMHVMQLHAEARKQIASPRLLDALLLRLLDRLGRNEWSGIVKHRPGTLRRLRGTLHELREAGIGPDQFRLQVSKSRRNLALTELYSEYSEALETLAGTGRVDDAGLIEAALPFVAAYARGYAAAFVHGVYELIGCHVDWIRGIDATTPVTVLLPCAPGARVSRFAETFATEHLISEGESLQAIPDGSNAQRRPALAALYDEEARPERSDCPFRFQHAQGQAAEARHAVRQALQAVRDGCAPSEIVITARSLEPYAAAIEEAFDDFGLPWSSPLASPLRRHPVVRDLLLLLQVLDEDFPRAATAELLRSRRFRWHELGSNATPPQGDRADAWSRSAGILGGIDEWTRDLPLWAEQIRSGSTGSAQEAEQAAARRGHAARQIADALSGLARRSWADAGSWCEHADKLDALRQLVVPGERETLACEAHEKLQEILDEMRGLDQLPDPPGRIRFAEMRGWLERAVDDSSLRLRGPDDGGIRVLDAMQLRGLTFRRLFLLGMNAGFFPASGAEDPVLHDADRTRLRRSTGRPIPVHGARVDEERLLLATTLGCASEAIEVSWQRSDESGRGKTPSLALREVARLALGRPDMAALIGPETHLPSHPTHALDQAVATIGLLTPAERRLLDALHLQGLDSLEQLGRKHKDLERGALMLRSTQSFHVGDEGYDASYDARIEPGDANHPFSVSALENLGRCPLRYFFAHVLGVREMDDPADLFEVTSREVGIRLHNALERVYRELMRNDDTDWSDASSLEAMALPLLDRERDRILGQFGARLQRRLPVLYEHLTDSWVERLRRFVQVDLGWIAEHGWQPAELEESLEVDLEFGSNRAQIRGRFDRRMTRGQEQRISDYKTSLRPEKKVSPTEALRGLALQVPLYWMMLDGQEVELLNIGPGFEPETYRHLFPGFDPAQASGFAETMNALLDLERAGVFPLRPDTHCNWCAFRAACRRTHPPTLEREQQFSDSRNFRRLRAKTRKLPRFADLPGDRA